MPRVFALLLLALVMGGTAPAMAQQPAGDELPVAIRIRDHSRVPTPALTHARRIVSRVYAQIGIRLDWVDVVRPKHDRPPTSSQPAQMTLVMVTDRMAAHGQIADDALGLAAVADHGMGRVAYVVYDRIRDTAQSVSMSEDDLLAYVIAHQIARLLMPAGAPFESHAMRRTWTQEEIRMLRVRKLTFSPLQASLMRETIQNDTPTLAVRAAQLGAGQP